MHQKNRLLEKLIKHPLEFDEEDFDHLISFEYGLTFDDLRSALKQVFKINESALLEESASSSVFNTFWTWVRQRRYFRKINNGFVGRHHDNRVIVAEGDSWFQFIGDDIISWLSQSPNYAIYSIAYAGDWLSNIILEGKYVEELSIHKPSAFLVSGGGNDLVGSNRLAIMTCRDPHKTLPVKRNDIGELLKTGGCTPQQAQQILAVQPHILPEFYSFLLILKCQYYLLFKSLSKSEDLKTMAIITQGYDYVIPQRGTRFDGDVWYQPFINKLIGSGRWLSQPLMIRGIPHQHEHLKDMQRSIMVAMVFELNEMFIDLAKRQEFKFLYHIDCRNNANGLKDWFDELHLKPLAFKRVADAYEECLKNHFRYIKTGERDTKNSDNIIIVKNLSERKNTNSQPLQPA